MVWHFNEKSIVHIFLPKRTPDCREDDLFKIEEDLLNFVTESFMENKNLVEELIPVQAMLEKWLDVQPKKTFVDPSQVEQIRLALEDLEVGVTIPIYIRQQNSTMLFSKFAVNDGELKVRVQTFRASFPAETIMSNMESLKMDFPETSNVIENESMLHSEIFASHVCEMAVEEFAISTVEFEGGANSECKIRDVPNPFLVSDWAVGILVPRDDADCPKVTKKIRDQVTLNTEISEGSLFPFRRSGMWMSIKVALHLQILQLFGNDKDTAKLVYKLVTLCVLVDACKSYEMRKNKPDFDLDLAAQMVAKVGRRVEKLQRLTGGTSSQDVFGRVEMMKLNVLEYTVKVLTEFNNTIQCVWRNVVASIEPEKLERIDDDDFDIDLWHTISPLDEFVNKAKQLLEESPTLEKPDLASIQKKSSDFLKRLRKKRFSTIQDILSAETSSHDRYQQWIWLHDTEQFVKGIEDENKMTSEELFNLGQRYITEARKVYNGNPVGFSQLMLVALKLTCILDKMATKKHPLVKKYKVDLIPESFDCLLLPHKQDIDLLNELLDYFKSRDSKCPRSILERDVDRESLSVRFAKQNTEMMKLRSRIQRDMDKATECKIQEAETVLKECLEVESNINNLHESACWCRYEWRRMESETNGEKVKVSTCELCILDGVLAATKTSVLVFEEPLPRNLNLQYAIIFELRIPEEISHLRQFLAILKYELLGEPVLNHGGVYEHYKDCHWLKYEGLSLYRNEGNSTGVINLGTLTLGGFKVKPPVIYQPDVLKAFKENRLRENFIIENRMDCNYFYTKQRPSVKNFEENCNFPFTGTLNSEPYHSLERYFASTKHSQNDVIANQNDCHKKLSQNEFITFGSLRAGHRIQLRNIYKAISSRSLSLENEPVLALILQTIWQVGPRDRAEREAHLDFQMNNEFSSEFLDMLDNLVKFNKSKYSSPLMLMAAIAITARILDLNEKCKWKCYELFKKWRNLTKTWSSKIEHDLCKDNNVNDVNTMHLIQYQIKMCSLLTYCCGPNHLANVCKDDEDILYLLETISSKDILTRESNPTFSDFMNILRFVEQMIPVTLNLDAQVKEGNGEKGMLRFLKEKYPSVRQYNDSDVIKTVNSNIFMVQYDGEFHVAIDVYKGESMLNGNPDAELSSQFVEHPGFRRVFQKHLNFHLQRVSMSILRTEHPYHGKHYEFRTENGTLEIMEIQNNSVELVLVPPQTFRGFLNDYFIDNYNHWLNPFQRRVYFRHIAENHNEYKLSHEYMLAGFGYRTNEWKLLDEVNNQALMSIKSYGFMQLTNALSSFELSKYTHVFMNQNNDVPEVHLLRHNLKFSLTENGLLESMEYPGFIVSSESAGTFVGLKTGLLLTNGQRRLMIIPHGKINMHEKSLDNMHHACEIDLESLSETTFHIYEIDEILKRVMAKKSMCAWLYLAALHAATSSSQPDPFTGMTGTEMAVNILQSALVWSCSPYDKECLAIQKFIKGLVPIRNYYNTQNGRCGKEAVETIKWPTGIPTMAAFDGYAYLINNLIRDSSRLQNLRSVEEINLKQHAKLLKNNFSDKLHLRSYIKNLNLYNDKVRLEDDAVKRNVPSFNKGQSQLKLRVDTEEIKLGRMMKACYIRHLCVNSLPRAENSLPVREDTLIPFLFIREPLFPNTEVNMGLALKNLLNLDFRSRWLQYYSTSKSDTVDQHEFSTLLSALAYRGAPLEQITNLHFIRILCKRGVEFPPVPELYFLNDPCHVDYDVSEIANILKAYSEPLPRGNINLDDHDEMIASRAELRQHDEAVSMNCLAISRRWKELYWPCAEIGGAEIVTLSGKQIIRNELDLGSTGNISVTALTDVNSTIITWYCARRLRTFMDEVQDKLNSYAYITLEQQPQLEFPVLQPVFTSVESQSSEMFRIQLEDLIDENEIDEALKTEAAEIFRIGRFGAIRINQSEDEIREEKQAHKQKVKEIEGKIQENIMRNVSHRILHKSGLSPRLSPVNLLQYLRRPDLKGHVLYQLVGALGVLWSNLKRCRRNCQDISVTQGEKRTNMESQNPQIQNYWSPLERPEWVLLELDLDISIRKIQIEVANQMMSMPDGRNGVMQFNMGQGKTSVIVPMLCSVLASDDSLCRVTVLSSIFKMNWNILKFAIGGLLNQRLYSFPCRRNMNIDELCANDIQAIYNECIRVKGVVVTLPEYRLSFRLLSYDNLLKGKTALGLTLLQTEDWLRRYARDILDESDELLSVKYQLVYPVGEHINTDGGEVRWLICQQVLDYVLDRVHEVLETRGFSCIGYNWEEATHEFVAVRLLALAENEALLDDFEKTVVEKFLARQMLTEAERSFVAGFILGKEAYPESEPLKEVMELLQKDSPLLNKVLLLAGYINRGILRLALSKRWRVEYGVDHKGSKCMAVPFRAKDVAAENTEFGHPDLAIMLTHLHYYYSGLSDEMLDEVFGTLAREPTPEVVYSQWIGKIPGTVHPSMSVFNRLNLRDALLKSKLFNLIRYHKMVVDFWLSRVVFPKESKQFPAKLLMTTANLVDERQRLPITGMSGTNDSIELLPLNIKQQDLKQLQSTNQEMEDALRRHENNGHKELGVGVTCKQILKQMKKDKLRILVDAGALMLELTNEQVAQLWLEIDTGIEAVVYFSKDNELMVKSRGEEEIRYLSCLKEGRTPGSSVGLMRVKKRRRKQTARKSTGAPRQKRPTNITRKLVPFELSPFQDRLEKCGVFLDDYHTRGTDLKFPNGSKACVTIGSGMERAKLLQACMRMRKLGEGHSVRFYVSDEASGEIKGVTVNGVSGMLSTDAVLEWVKLNTKKFNYDGMLHWTLAAKNYAQCLAAEDIFYQDPFQSIHNESEKTKVLAQQCLNDEVTALTEMYGKQAKLELMTKLISAWFNSARQRLIALSPSSPVTKTVISRFDGIKREVLDRCRKYVPKKRLLSSVTVADVEQETELEQEKEVELEEERQVERPQNPEPAKPSLHPKVIQMVSCGAKFMVADGIMRLSDIFKNTTFAGEAQSDHWPVDDIYVTNDFFAVIHSDGVGNPHYKTDSYLRPLEYFISKKKLDGTKQFLFLSPFEVNELLPRIRDPKTKCTLHMFAARKFEGQDMLLNLPELQVPPVEVVPVPPAGETFCAMESDSREMAALILASGSMFFNNKNEQIKFAEFLSLKPRPWTKDDQQLFETGMMTRTGFLLPECRHQQNVRPHGFEKDPIGLVMKILACRNSGTSENSHVAHLLEEKAYVELRYTGNEDVDESDYDEMEEDN